MGIKFETKTIRIKIQMMDLFFIYASQYNIRCSDIKSFLALLLGENDRKIDENLKYYKTAITNH
jgi:hypothetical protein